MKLQIEPYKNKDGSFSATSYLVSGINQKLVIYCWKEPCLTEVEAIKKCIVETSKLNF